MSVKIRRRNLNNNQTSLSLDIYTKEKRWREPLDLKVYTKATTDYERLHNKRVNALAEAKRADTELKVSQGVYEKSAIPLDMDVIAYMEKYIREYSKLDINSYKATLKKFKAFVKQDSFLFSQLNERVCELFQDYLYARLQGGAVRAYFKIFVRMITAAAKENIIEKNPAAFVRSVKKPTREKDTLTIEEVRLLQATDTPYTEVKRMFLFACFTGLRLVDVLQIRYNNIHGDTLSVIQSKTKLKVSIKLNENAKQYIGSGNPTDKIFTRIPPVTLLRQLDTWVRSAGINKHITFHSARHSFGTNLIIKGVDIRIIAKLLGHADLKMVMRYTRIADDLLKDAVSRLDE